MAADDLTAGADTPRAGDEFEGVLLSVSAPSAPHGPVDLSGLFQLTEERATAIDAHPHRALTIVMTAADGGLVGTPYRERVFFEDDVERAGALLRGFFRLRLVAPDQRIPAGVHWISVSLGEHLSNVVELVGGRESFSP